ncbi:MAG: leader peptidase (prepilin peptidase) / N-methyltransferase [Hyphomicrobiales bacterium]|jgi:leader peptidase (prepilin peptidase)/N-methyltransferase|nr:leader peptidase (prepilin peptidase) / N-methyltransferase [Hyphomicrobiales bacterium]
MRHATWVNAAVALVALAAAIASLMLVPGVRGYLGAGLALIAAAIAAVDARRFIIPDELSIAGLVLALAHAWANVPYAALEAVGLAVLRGIVLALMFLALRAIYRHLRGRHGIGLGDVKLAGVAGAWLDWLSAMLAIEIAALGALAFFALWHFAGRRTVRATSRVPFGVFLAPAIWIAWLIETVWLTTALL